MLVQRPHNRVFPLSIIAADAGHTIEVTFTTPYDIEQSDDCKYDSLTFQDGAFEFSPVILKLCGSGEAGRTVMSTTDYMRLAFKTDDAIEGLGFNLTYRFVKSPELTAGR